MIAGERRLRALQLLGESEAPVVIREASDQAALELALIENVQREELNAIEQAEAFQRLAEEFKMTQEQIAGAVGKDRSTITNTLRLLKLPRPVQEEVLTGRLTLGHARALLALESARLQTEVAQRAGAQGFSVRQVERLVREILQGGERRRTARARDPHVAEAEQRLQRALGTNVQIFHGRTRGWIRIAYYSLKDLDRLLARLN